MPSALPQRRDPSPPPFFWAVYQIGLEQHWFNPEGIVTVGLELQHRAGIHLSTKLQGLLQEERACAFLFWGPDLVALQPPPPEPEPEPEPVPPEPVPEPEPPKIRVISNRAFDDQTVADGQRIWREVMSDPKWQTATQESVAEKVRDSLHLKCHWRTVHRWIIEPLTQGDKKIK
jgi:hypothetical protein